MFSVVHNVKGLGLYSTPTAQVSKQLVIMTVCVYLNVQLNIRVDDIFLCGKHLPGHLFGS